MKKTKIICTMGPASENKEVLTKLIQNGMDIARLNFSHGDHEEQLRKINLIKQVREELNKPIAILLDTKGPEIRTGVFENDKALLFNGDDFTLTTDDVVGNNRLCSITYKELPNDVKIGDKILIDDGIIELKVREIADNNIHCTVINGGEVGNKKGINVPGVKVNLPSLTEKDREDIIFGVNNGVDFIAASFVRTADAVRDIRKLLDDCNADISIIAKIENQEGVNNIDEIVAEADGIMVARGDLGVEIPTEQVPFVQKKIIRKCNSEGKPVITATQMLDSMIRNPIPTRAEVTDIANAIYDGTDAIMLSGETAVGKFPVDSLCTMVKIAQATEEHLDYTQILKDREIISTKNIANAVSFSSCATAKNLDAKLIITASMTGFTARMVSRFRPYSQIIGITPLESVRRKMQIYWGVLPLLIGEVNSTDHLLERAVEEVKQVGLVEKDDLVVITAGVPAGTRGLTNTMKVVTIQ